MTEVATSPYKQMISEIPLHQNLPFEKSWLHRMDPRVRNTLEAWLKFGTVFLVYRMCMFYLVDTNTADTELIDKVSAQLVAYIMLGFTLYYLLIKPYVPDPFVHPMMQNIFNDTLMFGTVLVVSHLAESYVDGDTYFDADWLKTAAVVLVAFAAYRVFVNPFIPFGKMGPTVSPIVSDWAQFGTFLLIFRLLRGKDLNSKWLVSVLFVLLGFTGYHLVTKRLIK